jgi:hypothetical protein
VNFTDSCFFDNFIKDPHSNTCPECGKYTEEKIKPDACSKCHATVFLHLGDDWEEPYLCFQCEVESLRSEIQKIRLERDELTSLKNYAQSVDQEYQASLIDLRNRIEIAVDAFNKIVYLGARAGKSDESRSLWLQYCGAQSGQIARDALSKIQGET